MKNKEREKLIKRLCKIQLKHDKKLERVYKFFNENGEIFGAELDGCFIYEMYSIGLIEIVLDLMGMPCESDSFCRDYYNDVWSDCVEQSLVVLENCSEADSDDKIVKLYINIINRELDELLLVKPLSSFEKN